MAATSPSAIVSRQLSTQYGRAAPELLLWSQERQFFQIQIANCTKSNKSVEAAVAHNVERTIESLRDAALTCAAMGLSMNPIAQLVYFIPRRERTFNEDIDKSRAEYEQNVPWIIYPSPSYRGLAFICTRYAGADDVAAEVVFKADVFRPRGPFALPEHLPTTDNALRKWENAIGVYVGFRWPGGRERSEYLDANMVAIIRAKSDRPNSMMWDPKQLWTEGWKKAAVRRGAKLAIQGNPRLDAAEVNMRAHEGVTIDGEAREVPRGTSSDAPKAARPARGMGGLGDKLNAAEAKQCAAEEEAKAQAAAVAAAVPEAARKRQDATGSAPPDTLGAVNGDTKAADWFAESRHPMGSIEWWGDQLAVCQSRRELERLRVTALEEKVDQSADSETFTELYKQASRRIRMAQNKTAT
jgi:recombinational DNA repair protein RecT